MRKRKQCRFIYSRVAERQIMERGESLKKTVGGFNGRLFGKCLDDRRRRVATLSVKLNGD